MGFIERVVTVAGPEAIKSSQALAKEEGLFVGITSGATFAGALKVAAEAPEGANILAMLPDTAERYLSTALFENIPSDMTEEEEEIWRSTPFGLEKTASA
jgi:cysteine synthase A